MSGMIGSELIQAGYRYALSLTHNEHNAEDLVQDACYKLMRSRGRVEGKSLMFVTVRNLFIDRYRRSKRVAFEPYDESRNYENTDAGGEFDFTAGDMEKALAELRSDEREALYLHYYEGYSAREISGVTGKPRNTVLSLMARGKKRLEGILRGMGAAPDSCENGEL